MKKLNSSIFENPKNSSFDCQKLNKIHKLNNDCTGLLQDTASKTNKVSDFEGSMVSRILTQ